MEYKEKIKQRYKDIMRYKANVVKFVLVVNIQQTK